MVAAARVLLVRHAQTPSNVGGRGAVLSGWADVPLSARGLREAELLARRLARGPRFAALYSSTLSRALETARPLVRAGLGALAVRPDLREIGCGEVDGLPIEEVRQRHPDAWEKNLRQADDDFRWPGGESYRELRARALGVVWDLAERHAGESILVVTHAGPIGQVVGALRGERPARWGAHRPGNASITTLEVIAGRARADRWVRVVDFDDRTHLQHHLGGAEIAERGRLDEAAAQTETANSNL